MKTYKNKNFSKRNYESTNIVFCQSDINPDNSKWIEVDGAELEASTCKQLWLENGVKYFGWL